MHWQVTQSLSTCPCPRDPYPCPLDVPKWWKSKPLWHFCVRLSGISPCITYFSEDLIMSINFVLLNFVLVSVF